MIISIFTARHFDQRAHTTVSYWTVEGGSVTVARLAWDPTGPMSVRDAVLEVCRQVIWKLDPPARGGEGWRDEPLPGTDV